MQLLRQQPLLRCLLRALPELAESMAWVETPLLQAVRHLQRRAGSLLLLLLLLLLEGRGWAAGGRECSGARAERLHLREWAPPALAPMHTEQHPGEACGRCTIQERRERGGSRESW